MTPGNVARVLRSIAAAIGALSTGLGSPDPGRQKECYVAALRWLEIAAAAIRQRL